jgi:hypothetical protein
MLSNHHMQNKQINIRENRWTITDGQSRMDNPETQIEDKTKNTTNKTKTMSNTDRITNPGMNLGVRNG